MYLLEASLLASPSGRQSGPFCSVAIHPLHCSVNPKGSDTYTFLCEANCWFNPWPGLVLILQATGKVLRGPRAYLSSCFPAGHFGASPRDHGSDLRSDVFKEQPWGQSTSWLPFFSSDGKLTDGKKQADYPGLIPHKRLPSSLLIRGPGSWLVAKSHLQDTIFLPLP